MAALACLLGWLLVAIVHTSRSPVVTLVTTLYDVKRGELKSGFRRSYQYYLKYYEELLQTENNLVVFGDAKLKQFTAQRRNRSNTVFIQKQLSDIEKYWYTPKIWKVIEYYQEHAEQYEWEKIVKVTQFGLKMYNPVVMSKLYMMREAYQHDSFGTDYFIWVDGGFTHALDKQFLHRRTFDKVVNHYQIDWFFVASTYFVWDTMQIKFYRDAIRYRVEDPLEKAQTNCWANWFGGKVQALTTVLSIYQNLLRVTLDSMEMNTDESVFTLMLQRYPFMLTKLNIRYPQQFSQLEAERLSYDHSVVMQRSFKLSDSVKERVTLYSDLKPLVTVKVDRYDETVQPEISRMYQTALIVRVLVVAAELLLYYRIKTHYLSSTLPMYQNIDALQQQ